MRNIFRITEDRTVENILVNRIKYTGTNENIVIVTRKEDKSWKDSIEGKGKGNIPEVFNPFLAS